MHTGCLWSAGCSVLRKATHVLICFQGNHKTLMSLGRLTAQAEPFLPFYNRSRSQCERVLTVLFRSVPLKNGTVKFAVRERSERSFSFIAISSV